MPVFSCGGGSPGLFCAFLLWTPAFAGEHETRSALAKNGSLKLMPGAVPLGVEITFIMPVGGNL